MTPMIQIINTSQAADYDRTEAFEAYAEQVAEGAIAVAPTALSPNGRRLYVRDTLREDNLFRIDNRPEGAQEKFRKLRRSLFDFFRGTALLFYRDMAGADAHLPTVLAIGDIHPENFGVMPNADGSPFFGINDFDEAHFAPFSWDLRRGATGFWIACRENGWNRKKRAKIVRAFVQGYLDGLKEFAVDDREKSYQYRIDNSPPLIRDLLESAMGSRKKFLSQMIDLDKGKFLATRELVPFTGKVDKFQKAIDKYKKSNDILEGLPGGHFRVKDVAVKKGSGTASLGLDRYLVLIDAESDDNADDIVLEMKQARRSALYGLATSNLPVKKGKKSDGEHEAEVIVKSHQVHLVGGDPYYGTTTLEKRDFLVRERSPFKEDYDHDDLNKSQMLQYAGICGRTLSIAHARSDEDTGVMEGNAEETILAAIEPKLLLDDMVRFAEETSERMLLDYKAFKQDYKLGAFKFVHGK
jgi:uncharacterized protein (DUF2252 family)